MFVIIYLYFFFLRHFQVDKIKNFNVIFYNYIKPYDIKKYKYETKYNLYIKDIKMFLFYKFPFFLQFP